jgi:hypothetical protein
VKHCPTRFRGAASHSRARRSCVGGAWARLRLGEERLQFKFRLGRECVSKFRLGEGRARRCGKNAWLREKDAY